MAAESRGTRGSLNEQLANEAWRFDFFQAVRLLERRAAETAREEPGERRYRVGEDHDPAREVVRFRTLQSMSFPASSIYELREGHASPSGRGRGAAPPPEMVVTFMGLTGPSGVLPYHYSRLLIERARAKDFALQDFFDLFTHRLVSFMYRAWEKYRLPLAFERERLEPEGSQDLFSRCLFSLAGFGTEGLRRHLPVDDQTVLYYAGLFADGHRTATSLERLLSEFFALPARVVQFTGQWLPIDASDWTRLPGRGRPGRRTTLGVDTVIGQRVWSRRSKFRMQVGPLGFREFRAFLPSGSTIAPFCRMVRLYVGPDLDFDVEAQLAAAEVPPLRLRASGEYEPRLGWTTWLVASPMQEAYKSVVLESVDSAEGAPAAARSASAEAAGTGPAARNG